MEIVWDDFYQELKYTAVLLGSEQWQNMSWIFDAKGLCWNVHKNVCNLNRHWRANSVLRIYWIQILRIALKIKESLNNKWRRRKIGYLSGIGSNNTCTFFWQLSVHKRECKNLWKSSIKKKYVFWWHSSISSCKPLLCLKFA